MGLSTQKRFLERLIRALGEDDQLSESPKLDAKRIVLTSMIDDLTFAHAAQAVGRMSTFVIPSVNAAQFSAFEFTPLNGLWIREMQFSTSANMGVLLGYGISPGAFAANDGLGTGIICGRPEDTDFPAFLQTTWTTAISGSATVPRIFKDAQIGRQAAAPGGLVLYPIATPIQRDFYVPAGATLHVTSLVANTALTVFFQIDLPAENFYT